MRLLLFVISALGLFGQGTAVGPATVAGPSSSGASSGGGGNNIVRVQPATSGTVLSTCSSGTGGTAQSCSFASLPTVGNLILITCAANSTETWSLPTDNQTGNTYNAISGATINGTGVSIGWWWAKVVGSTGTFTVTCHAGTSAFLSVLPLEYQGTQTASPIDSSTAGQGLGTLMTPGPLTPGTANVLLLGACANANSGSGTAVFTPVSGFTIQNQVTDDNLYQPVASQDQIVTTIASYTASMTFSISGGNTYACGVVAVKST